tara:strand:- start:498 stop:767 length:270 start_codon:yes stop_codon:yes gene_type:complete
MEVVVEEVFEKIINDTLFKKENWISKILKKIKCRSSCFCSIDPDEVIEKKKKQKDQVMQFIKILKRNSLKLESQIQEEDENKIILETEI